MKLAEASSHNLAFYDPAASWCTMNIHESQVKTSQYKVQNGRLRQSWYGTAAMHTYYKLQIYRYEGHFVAYFDFHWQFCIDMYQASWYSIAVCIAMLTQCTVRALDWEDWLLTFNWCTDHVNKGIQMHAHVHVFIFTWFQLTLTSVESIADSYLPSTSADWPLPLGSPCCAQFVLQSCWLSHTHVDVCQFQLVNPAKKCQSKWLLEQWALQQEARRQMPGFIGWWKLTQTASDHEMMMWWSNWNFTLTMRLNGKENKKPRHKLNACRQQLGMEYSTCSLHTRRIINHY